MRWPSICPMGRYSPIGHTTDLHPVAQHSHTSNALCVAQEAGLGNLINQAIKSAMLRRIRWR